MASVKSWQSYLVLLPTILVILGNAFEVNAKPDDIFTPYLKEIASSLPQGWEMRLPEQIPAKPLVQDRDDRYYLAIDRSTDKLGLAVRVFDCQQVALSCLAGSFAVNDATSLTRQLFKQYQSVGSTVKLYDGIEGFYLEGTESPTSSLMWEQDGKFYTASFNLRDRRYILDMAYSMSSSRPIKGTRLAEKPQQVAPPTRIKIPATFLIKKVKFVGNTAFSDDILLAEILKVNPQFIEQPITFAQLLEAEAVVTKLYVENGFINSGAVIPADQKTNPKDGSIEIQVIEGGLEAIKVQGTQRLNADYVSSRLAIATNKPLNQKRLLEALQLLRLDPLIAGVSAELSAGSRPELSILDVKVTEAEPFSAQINLDNGRSPSVGDFRRGVQFGYANLSGLGDSIGGSYTNTNGSNAFDLSYTLPINPQNGTISFTYGKATSNVVEPPFDRVDITGNSQSFQLTARQPLFQTPTQEFALGLTASRQDSQTTLLGEAFPLSPGADERGQTRISALRFFQDYTTRNPVEVFAARSQFSVGLGIFNATINQEAPDSRFLVWRGQAQYVRNLAPETLLLTRLDVQFADRTLVPLEQFALGGLRSVRGYRQDALLTDNGIFGSAELRLPVLRVPEWLGLLQIVPFVDFGTTWNGSGKSNPQFSTLFSPGLGLQLLLGDRFTARLDYAIPAIDTNSNGQSLKKNGIYFSLDYKGF